MRLTVALVALAALATPALADEISPPDFEVPHDCDPAAQADHAALVREHDSARRWNTAWTITYGAMAVVQVGAAVLEFSPGKEFDDAARANLYIGAGKATIGMLSRIVIPLRVPVPMLNFHGCAEPRALAAARRVAARKERNTFWLQLGGGAALHLIGGGYLVVHEDAWRDALMSLALGAVVSTITLYTEPKTSWRHPVTVVPMPARDGLGLAVVGAF